MEVQPAKDFRAKAQSAAAFLRILFAPCGDFAPLRESSSRNEVLTRPEL